MREHSTHGPTGIEQIQTAVREIDALDAEIARLRAKRDTAERDLAALVASGSCAQHGCALAHDTSSPPPASPFPRTRRGKVPIVWQIALRLLETPRLDYAAVGEAIWGPGLPLSTVKNRISTNLAYLTSKKVISPRGNNTYSVNKTVLAELTGLSPEALP